MHPSVRPHVLVKYAKLPKRASLGASARICHGHHVRLPKAQWIILWPRKAWPLVWQALAGPGHQNPLVDTALALTRDGGSQAATWHAKLHLNTSLSLFKVGSVRLGDTSTRSTFGKKQALRLSMIEID